jgi:hypothetical protein
MTPGLHGETLPMPRRRYAPSVRADLNIYGVPGHLGYSDPLFAPVIPRPQSLHLTRIPGTSGHGSSSEIPASRAGSLVMPIPLYQPVQRWGLA